MCTAQLLWTFCSCQANSTIVGRANSFELAASTTIESIQTWDWINSDDNRDSITTQDPLLSLESCALGHQLLPSH